MARRYRRLVRDATGLMVGAALMGAVSNNANQQSQPAMNMANAAMGLAGAGLMMDAASGLMGEDRRRRRRRR